MGFFLKTVGMVGFAIFFIICGINDHKYLSILLKPQTASKSLFLQAGQQLKYVNRASACPGCLMWTSGKLPSAAGFSAAATVDRRNVCSAFLRSRLGLLGSFL